MIPRRHPRCALSRAVATLTVTLGLLAGGGLAATAGPPDPARPGLPFPFPSENGPIQPTTAPFSQADDVIRESG